MPPRAAKLPMRVASSSLPSAEVLKPAVLKPCTTNDPHAVWLPPESCAVSDPVRCVPPSALRLKASGPRPDLVVMLMTPPIAELP